jgi:ankyrin repeat protein
MKKTINRNFKNSRIGRSKNAKIMSDDDSDSDVERSAGSQLLHYGKSCQNLPEDVSKMSSILASDPMSLERREPFFASELSPLQHAISQGHDNCVRFLLAAGADVSQKTRDNGRGVLELAIMSQNEDVVRLVLEHGVSPNYVANENSVSLNKSFYLALALSNCESLR